MFTSACGFFRQRLKQGQQERYDFCMLNYEINERTVRVAAPHSMELSEHVASNSVLLQIQNVLAGARYAAGHLKKQLASMPSPSTKEYARLHKAYTLQVTVEPVQCSAVWNPVRSPRSAS